MDQPTLIDSEDSLEEVLTTPSSELVAAIGELADPLVILGAGGKMGPTLAVLAKRAAEVAGQPLRVVAASRFSNPASRQWLESRGVETVAIDLFQREDLKQLPNSANVVYLVGMKFGTSSNPVPTWATNTIVPTYAAERYATSKIVALSTGNVYPLTSRDTGGSSETDPLTPMGEYANAAVARERVFGYFAERDQTPTLLVRLNYAHDLRYGVMTDIVNKVWTETPIDLTMGYFNAIWQGDANEMILRAFKLCEVPARAINLTSPAIYSVREVAERAGELLDRQPLFSGTEATSALLSNASQYVEHFGKPRVDLERLLGWVVHWTRAGGTTLGKPTHFETRDGKY